MSYDWALDENGDLTETGLIVEGDAAVFQALKIQLGTARGEWVLDLDQGLPWLEWSQFAPAPLFAIEARVLAEILSVRGVARVERSEVTFDPSSMRVEGDFVVVLTSSARARIDLSLDPIQVSNNPALVVGLTPIGALSSR